MQKVNFASDNYAGAHSAVMRGLVAANEGPARAYGCDECTQEAVKQFKTHFGGDCEVFFVCNGTAANVTALSTINQSYHAVICSDLGHIQVDECGAIEKYIGTKLLLVPSKNGKIHIHDLEKFLERMNDQHAVQPKTISISQTTEYGTVYSIAEIKALADFAHQHHMFLHMDGARVCNAAASLNTSLRSFTKDAGVDILSFGGTKNGMMLGEAVIFFNPEHARDYLFIRKQSMQLISKMRFISAQFSALLHDDLWLKNAVHANAMARLLADKLRGFTTVQITRPVEANVVFAILPKAIIEALQKQFYFYVWNSSLSEVRLMTSFSTTENEIDTFIDALSKVAKAGTHF